MPDIASARRPIPLGVVDDTSAVDPVCGMTVPATRPRGGSHTDAGAVYHFCCEACRRKFAADPAKYLSGAAEPMADRLGVRYVCPMDPEVSAAGPSPCPVCGMALEPAVATGDAGPDPELLALSRRLVGSTVLGVPLLVLAMAPMLVPGLPTADAVLQAVLATPVVLWGGASFFARGWRSVRTGRLNMFTLLGLGIGVSYAASLAALFTDSMAHDALFFDTAAAIVVLSLAGQVLELRARGRTGDAVRQLLRAAPRTARVLLADGREEDLPLELVRVGDRVRVRPGERLPVDGTVVEGLTAIDESTLTGEPVPADKGPGSAVLAGTLNGLGAVVVAVGRAAGDTVLAQVIHLVGEARRTRVPVQARVDRVAARFVPGVILAAGLTFAGWALVTPAGVRAGAAAAVGVLVVACPCALGLATPVALVVGIGRGAGLGVLFRDAAALERLAAVDAVVVDKTGTLTEGRPEVVAVVPAAGRTADELVRLAAAVEAGSEHPLAAAVGREAARRGLAVEPAAGVRAEPGRGVRGGAVLVGSPAFLAENGVPGEPWAADAAAHRQAGRALLVVADGPAYAGLIAAADPVRPTSAAAVGRLRAAGLRVVLCTGDHEPAARVVADQVGIGEVVADALPADKYALVRRLRDDGRVVAVAGDGVNDAPALAAADVGIALGTGAAVAVAAAGVTLVRPDLRGVAAARDLSRATVWTIRQNLLLAFGYNLVAVPAAAAGLLDPMGAAAAMALSSAAVVGNSLRLGRSGLRAEGFIPSDFAPGPGRPHRGDEPHGS